MRRFLLRVFVLAVLVTVGAQRPASAGPLTGVDILNLTGITESSLTDGNMTQARSELLGAGATITDVSVGSFSAANLVGIDILYAGLIGGNLTASQLAAIHAFSAAGGGIVAVGTERDGFSSPTFEQISNSFGLFGIGGDRTVSAGPADPGSTIVTGPFGTAAHYTPAATGAFSSASVISTGADVVWRADDGNAIIVTLAGAGRLFFFGDTNFMEDPYIGGPNNSIIWGNAFAFAGQVDQPAVPEPASLLLLGSGLFFVARRRWTRP